MTDNTPSRVPWSFIAIGIAIVISTYLAASSWERVKMKPPDRSIQVTGSAKKQIMSDQIEWSASIATQDMDRTAAYRNLHGYVQTTLAYLKEQGVKEQEIRASSATVEERYETEYVGIGEERVERQAFRGYATSETVSVRSTDVARVERISREVTQLLERGVPISSSAPAYFYTKLGELKIEMLAEAARDARNRAENIVRQAGGDARLGDLRAADMGVINVNPVNSTQTSWEGNNDTTSLEKDIITIVHITFELI
ncbi:MAG: SIMPL domain-containing protein [Deltaproteobacteria bacterium]|nr:SIMPL domain-containing protein [Deltaproteobacteria bacterium]